MNHQPTMKLDQSKIVEAGLRVLARGGLDALNMRAIASELGVGASALYRHVENKSELSSLIAESVYRHAFLAAKLGGDWRDRLLIYGRVFRQNLLENRDTALLCAQSKPLDTNTEIVGDWLAGLLTDSGLKRQAAISYLGSVTSLVLGWVIYEQSSNLHDHLAAMMDFDESFETGLQALVSGLPNTQSS